MKKIIALLLALVMVFALVACGNPGVEQPSGDPQPGGPSTPINPDPVAPTGTVQGVSLKEAFLSRPSLVHTET